MTQSPGESVSPEQPWLETISQEELLNLKFTTSPVEEKKKVDL